MAAARLGIPSVVWTPDAESPASHVAAETIVAPWDDAGAMAALAEAADVVTLEFENVPLATLTALAEKGPVRPGPRALEVSQDRLLEKTFANELAIPTAPFRQIDTLADIGEAIAELGAPAILKTRRLGYDGKGQARLDSANAAESAWGTVGGAACVLEGFVPFERELSVIVARAANGACRSWDIVENQHENHILRRTIAPADVPTAVAVEARRIGETLAAGLKLVGLLAVEMFLLDDGALLVNEIAPRPHNSGHWTIDACHVSQFEQLVRAVTGLPLGDPVRHSDAEMLNLLGEEAENLAADLSTAGACVHLYGKTEARPGRKMGHVTRIRPRSQ